MSTHRQLAERDADHVVRVQEGALVSTAGGGGAQQQLESDVVLQG